MIGNRFSWGEQGFTILEEGEINRQTLQLDIQHYLVCRPDGSSLGETFTLEGAKAEIERLEQGASAGQDVF